MRIQVLFLLPLLSAPAAADCFDFNAKIVTPLKEPIAVGASGDASDKGKSDEGVTWGQVRGKVDRPIGRLYEMLLDHNTTKSPRADEMTVDRTAKAGYLA